ncbi:efflux transporter outer membrane subunit [Undibacterium arcticum]
MPFIPRKNRTARPSWRLLAISAAAALLSACASFNGISPTASTQTPGDYASAATLPSQGGQWPDASWVGHIGGAPLQILVDEALRGNPGLQIAAARVSAARAIADATGAATKPMLDAGFSSTYQRFTENGLIPPPLAGQYKSDNELALNFSYEFDFWGKHAAELRAALSQGKVAEAEQYSARLVLAGAVTRAWVQLARQSEQLGLTEQQLQLREKLDRLTQQRVRAGLDNQSDNQQTQVQLAGLRAEQAQWQEAIALTRNQLAALLGQGPDRGLAIALPMLPAASATQIPDELPLALLGRRPDIVAARWRVEAAQGDIDSAKTAFYPNIDLKAFAGFSAFGLTNLLDSGSRIVGIGPAITVPIFNGGRLRAQLKGQVAAYDGAVASYNQSLTEALHEVADQVQSLRAVETQGNHQRQATSAAAQALTLAQQRQQVGTANMLHVLAAESAWLTQRKLELDTQARRADLEVGLIKALGGGFDAAQTGLAATTDTVPSSSTSNRSTFAKSAS